MSTQMHVTPSRARVLARNAIMIIRKIRKKYKEQKIDDIQRHMSKPIMWIIPRSCTPEKAEELYYESLFTDENIEDDAYDIAGALLNYLNIETPSKDILMTLDDYDSLSITYEDVKERYL